MQQLQLETRVPSQLHSIFVGPLSRKVSTTRIAIMSQTEHCTQLPIQVFPLDVSRDLPEVTRVWNAALPRYPLPAESLEKLLPKPNAHHLVARMDSTIVGFSLSYTSDYPGPSGYLTVLAVHPERQGQGVGTTLVAETLAWFRSAFEPCNLILGSSFPRFWPGVPTDLSPGVLEFFARRGFHIRPPTPRAVDLYRDIREYQAPEKYVVRAKEGGYTFAPLQPEHYAECLEGQKRNFSYNPAWVDMFFQLDPKEHPSSIMAAFDPRGKQVGWTLMLSPASRVLQENWALPPLCGPKTGLIGCVGIDKDARGTGIGVALVSHAVENMRGRGIEGVFVDWVSMEGYYEKLGFEVWRSYRVGEISPSS
ncbi:putative beta-N-acetylglucosaminidase [Aspergillus lucknowensis]|uniref:Acyl-CoA N-acyltransferase n=1 Tax=Aspergillus lucknowensis TaxID=176173 RepID=A0ABR4LRB7_9EURO